MYTVLEEQATRVASFIYNRATGDLSISLFFFFIFFFFLIYYHASLSKHLCIQISVGSLLPGMISGIAKIPKEMMESLVRMTLKATTAEGLESSIPVLDVVIHAVLKEVPASVSEANVPPASTEKATPMVDESLMSISNLSMEPTQKPMESSISNPWFGSSTGET